MAKAVTQSDRPRRWLPMKRTTWWVLLNPAGEWFIEKAFWDADLARRTAKAWNLQPPKYPARYPNGSWRLRVVRIKFQQASGQPKGAAMAAAKVKRVVVEQQRNGGWKWTPTDAQGRVKLAGGRSDYSRKDTAVRGARRACGAGVKVAFA